MSLIAQVSPHSIGLCSFGSEENRWLAYNQTHLSNINYHEDTDNVVTSDFEYRHRKAQSDKRNIYVLQNDTIEILNSGFEVVDRIDVKLVDFWIDGKSDHDFIVGVDSENCYYGRRLEEKMQFQKATLAKLCCDSLYLAKDGSLCVFDIKTHKQRFSLAENVRAIEVNHVHPVVFCTGDDQQVQMWDERNLRQPLKQIYNHSHWIQNIKMNTLNEQLVLTSSTDTLVNLELLSESNNSPSLLHSFDELDDSVYGVEWSPLDPWVFAAVSYSGRVLVTTVPQNTRHQLLGI
jgi:WD40 repeat protein